MNNGESNTLKIRFRLPNGEEFEAQGPREFIERERNYFLTLINQGQTAISPTQILNPQVAAASPIISQNISPTIHTDSHPHTDLRLWEHLFKEDGNTLILRRKQKLEPTELAVLLLAGARVLLQKESYPALDLAHSFKACGGKGGRLDRLLAPELQTGHIQAIGSKRSRTYHLTAEGFVRAFVLAEKLIKSTNY